MLTMYRAQRSRRMCPRRPGVCPRRRTTVRRTTPPPCHPGRHGRRTWSRRPGRRDTPPAHRIPARPSRTGSTRRARPSSPVSGATATTCPRLHARHSDWPPSPLSVSSSLWRRDCFCGHCGGTAASRTSGPFSGCSPPTTGGGAAPHHRRATRVPRPRRLPTVCSSRSSSTPWRAWAAGPTSSGTSSPSASNPFVPSSPPSVR